MKISEIEKRLKAWADRCEAVDKVYEDMRRLVGIEIEGPLASQLYGALEDYTAAMSEIVGDKDGWLHWYRYECDMGKKPKGMRFAGDKRDRMVKDVRGLAKAIGR